MKFHYCFFLLFFLNLVSCNIDRPCKNASSTCNDSYNSFFRIINKTTGQDLVFGPNTIYDKSKIKIFSTKGVDTTYEIYEPYRLIKDNYDSVLSLRLLAKVDTIFIKLNPTDIDTIVVSYGLSEGRCCTFNSIRYLSYNNIGVIPNFNGTVEFKK